MSHEMLDLARRAVACKGWRWLPGMLALPFEGMVSTPVRLTDERDWPHDIGLRVPDLSDPATLGCVLELVREAWGKPNGQLRFDGVLGSDPRGWYYYWTANDGSVGGGMYRYSVTEAEALVAALEAAP